MQQTLFDLKEDALGRMLVDWKKKKIRRAEGAGGFVREKNHSLSIRAKACHLLAPLGKRIKLHVTGQPIHGAIQMPNKRAVLLTSSSDIGHSRDSSFQHRNVMIAGKISSALGTILKYLFRNNSYNQE